MKTKILSNGTEVLAREIRGELVTLKYGNHTAAAKKVAELGPGWFIHRPRAWGPFYVGKTKVAPDPKNLYVEMLAELERSKPV